MNDIGSFENQETTSFPLTPKKTVETSWGHHYYFSDKPKETYKSHRPELALSREGEAELLPNLGFQGIMKDIYDPTKFQGVLVGEGSEGRVYSYTINDKEYAVKLYSQGIQDEMSKRGRMLNVLFTKPNFLEYFNYSVEVTNVLKNIPFKSFELSPLAEYAATEDAVIMEMGSKVTLDDLSKVLSPQDHESQKSDVPSEATRQFIERYNLTNESIQLALEEVNDLKKITQLLEDNEISPLNPERSHTHCDINEVNFLVDSFDEQTGKFVFRPIDLGQRQGDTSRSEYTEGRRNKAYKALYDYCIQNDSYRTFLEMQNIKAPEKINLIDP